MRLEVAPSGYAHSEEQSGSLAAGLVGYLFLGPWTNWFHDRRVRVDLGFDLTVRDSRSGTALVRSAIWVSDEEDLSFWERRGGIGPTIATLFWVPSMALDSDPSKTHRLLAPGVFDRAAAEVLRTLACVRLRPVDVIEVRTLPCDRLSARILSPIPGPERKLRRIAVWLRGENIHRIRKIWAGGRLVYDASDFRLSSDVKDLVVGTFAPSLAAGRQTPVVVQFEDGPPFPIAEVAVRRGAVLDGPP